MVGSKSHVTKACETTAFIVLFWCLHSGCNQNKDAFPSVFSRVKVSLLASQKHTLSQLYVPHPPSL